MYQEKQHEYELLLAEGRRISKEREHEEALAKEQEALRMYQEKQHEYERLLEKSRNGSMKRPSPRSRKPSGCTVFRNLKMQKNAAVMYA